MCEVSEILNRSSPSGQVLWREKVSLVPLAHSTVTMSRTQRGMHEENSRFSLKYVKIHQVAILLEFGLCLLHHTP